MGILSESEARAILDKVIALSKADECSAILAGNRKGNIRFARNEVSTSGMVDDADLIVSASYGKRTGTSTINQFDDASLLRVVRRAEELARLAPENPEAMPALPKQDYAPTPTWSASTAAYDEAARAKVAAASIEAARKQDLVVAGYLADSRSFQAIANSRGNFGYQTAADLNYTATARTADGRGSGWVGRSLRDAADFDVERDIAIAIRKARDSADAKALEPGKYTVVLEPAAVADLMAYMMFYFDARSADEGRSFLTKKGGGNRMGEAMFDPRISIWSDPADPGVPVLPWEDDGLPRQRTAWIDKGNVAALMYSRYWAQKQGKQPTAFPANLVMAGGSKSTADLVRETARGILVTRTWYIRMVDEQTVLLTGLTRDGTFYIEDGKIKHPVKNFRFNESPVIMLNNIDELGKPVRLAGDEVPFPMMVPPMKVRDFTFTSLSDAV